MPDLLYITKLNSFEYYWVHTKMCFCYGLYVRYGALASSCAVFLL